MPLSDADVERYARQIIVPGVGASGQERLLASRVLVCGNPRGSLRALTYLQAAGVTTVGTEQAATAQAVALARAEQASAPMLARLRSLRVPVAWYCLQAGQLTSGVFPGKDFPRTRTREQPPPPDCVLDDCGGAEIASLLCATIVRLPTRAT